jgi:hypothetical protein
MKYILMLSLLFLAGCNDNPAGRELANYKEYGEGNFIVLDNDAYYSLVRFSEKGKCKFIFIERVTFDAGISRATDVTDFVLNTEIKERLIK